MTLSEVKNPDKLDLIPFEVAQVAKFYGYYEPDKYVYLSGGDLREMDCKREISLSTGMQSCCPAPTVENFLKWLDHKEESRRRKIINLLQIDKEYRRTIHMFNCGGIKVNGNTYLPH